MNQKLRNVVSIKINIKLTPNRYSEKHNEVRHRWLHPVDLKKLEKMKAYGFTTGWHQVPHPRQLLSHG